MWWQPAWHVVTCFTLVPVQITLMDEKNGNTRDDMKLPSGTDEAERLAAQMLQLFKEEKEVTVTVTGAMNEEMVSSLKVANEAK